MTARLREFGAIPICALVWGTSWYVITLQLGTVDPGASLAYRFGLASTILFIWTALRGQPVALSRNQHAAALGVGVFSFTIDYGLTYLAEQHVVSAVVAVVFAALAFVNLIVFRVACRESAPRAAWGAAAIGAVGVALLSWGEIVHARFDHGALTGLVMAVGGVVAAAIGNVFARRGEEAGAPLAVSVAWSMGYGAFLLAGITTVRGAWGFDASPRYVLALLYLALAASVLAFVLYFGLARRHGFTLASYILALTPVLAITMSTVFEGKRWSGQGLGGAVLVLAGQWTLLRVQARDEPPGGGRTIRGSAVARDTPPTC